MSNSPAMTIEAPIDETGPLSEEDKKSLEAGEGTEAPSGAEEGEAPKLAGKFATAEELEKAYLELQAKLGQPEGEESETPPSEATEEEAGEALESVGLNINEFTSEFDETGALSDASYKKLADAGIPREIVDAYIEGQLAKQEATVTAVKAVAGGDEGYARMADWAQRNLSKGELTAFNKAVSGTDVEAVKLAVQGMYARYTDAMGNDPDLIGGDVSGSGTAISPFRSMAELTAAMRDPRYKKDEAYRADVERRLAKSNVL